MHKQTAMLYTEETFIERGHRAPSNKAQTNRLSITQRILLIFNLKEFRVRDFRATSKNYNIVKQLFCCSVYEKRIFIQ